MKSKWKLLFVLPVLGLALSACGKTLTVAHQHVDPSGLAAVIKGSSNKRSVKYRINNGSAKTVKPTNGTYSFVVPGKQTTQEVTIQAGSTIKTVTIAKQAAISKYSDFASKYNQAVIFTHLPQKQQANAKVAQKQGTAMKKQAAMIQKKMKENPRDPTTLAKAQKLQKAGAKLKQQQASLQAAMAKAKTNSADQQVVTDPKSGITNIVKEKNLTIRGNVDDGQLVGLAMLIPTKTLKNKTEMKTFGTSLALMVSATGANAQKVLKQFQKVAKKNNSGSTTIKTINSNGVNFKLGFSTSTLYIYATK